ncbi:cupin domain-containing protein [Sphingomonas crusticola]|uniref:cupin domain-containing protein n=1 Tax=Sphingomonas crusticola TaxID=1697973 RepID=UPI000E241ECF|nr:cupin domain-containing protein [Sphingomonas crusticola]
MPKIDLAQIPESNRTGYPPPFDQAVAGRWVRRLAPATGLTEFGVSFVRLEPGAWSSQRHWHEGEDEFLVMLSGAALLIDDAGEQPLAPGDCVAFPKGDRNGHHVVNRGEADCTFLCMSGGADAGGEYPDIDMLFTAGGYTRKDGTLYPSRRVK